MIDPQAVQALTDTVAAAPRSSVVKRGISTTYPELSIAVAVVDVYSPPLCREEYGPRHQDRLISVLHENDIAAVPAQVRQRNTSPLGTGPYGRVRMGDDMMPKKHLVVVNHFDEVAAKAVLAQLYEDNDWSTLHCHAEWRP